MDSADVEAIGAHCQFPYCHQLDFLPFRCESCRATYCLDHRTETAHKCPNAGAWAAMRRRNSIGAATATTTTTPSTTTTARLQQETKCALPACKTQINTARHVGVQCTSCNRQYCLKHRFRDGHECAKLTPLGARAPSSAFNAAAATQTERARLALSRLRAWGKDKQSQLTSTGGSTSSRPGKPSGGGGGGGVVAATCVTVLNELKKTAKGDAKLLPERRIYLHVEASAESTTAKLPQGAFFYDRDWTVGRMLDAAAKALQVQNVNNRGSGEEERLRVFHVEGGRLLDFGERLARVVVSGNTLVLLRGVGPAG